MAQKAKESARLRQERIAGTSNGMTLRPRVVKDRKKYSRKIKHMKKSIAEAMDFALIAGGKKTHTSLVGDMKAA